MIILAMAYLPAPVRKEKKLLQMRSEIQNGNSLTGSSSRTSKQHKRNKESVNSLAKLRELLDDKDLDRIETPSKKFRKGFKLH